jgi:hypothetical protein
LQGAPAPHFDENEKGSIQQGKLADLPLTFPVSEETAKKKLEVKRIKEKRQQQLKVGS